MTHSFVTMSADLGKPTDMPSLSVEESVNLGKWQSFDADMPSLSVEEELEAYQLDAYCMLSDGEFSDGEEVSSDDCWTPTSRRLDEFDRQPSVSPQPSLTLSPPNP